MVSIIVPMKNAMPFLPRTLHSLLSQTYPEIEVLVVDDHSTDRSVDYARSIRDPRLRILANQGHGCTSGFNTALSVARGEILMKCDADDWYPVDRVANQVEWLTHHPEIGAVSGYMSFVWTDGTPIVDVTRGETEPIRINDELAVGIVRSTHCAMAYRTAVVRAVGGMRDWFRTCADIDFLIRISEKCDVWHVNQHAYVARLHNRSITRTTKWAIVEWYLAQACRFHQQRMEEGKDDLQRGVPPTPPSNTQEGTLKTARMVAAGLLIGQAWRELECGDLRAAILYALRCVPYQPAIWNSWRTCVGVLLKAGLRFAGLRPGQDGV